MEALNDIVRAGKVRYIGASAMWAWQFQKALYVAEKHGWTRFISMQNHLNLIYREEEREMLPLCREEKIGVIPYSPLASGRLTHDWSSETTLRSETDQIAKGKYDSTSETDQRVIERVAELAKKYEIPHAHVAIAWLLQKEPVTAPIIGATKISHLEESVNALSVKLTHRRSCISRRALHTTSHHWSSINKVRLSPTRPTKRAANVWDSARFSSIFLAWIFFCFRVESQPTTTRLTQIR